jgi:hypothetical protein
MTAYATSEFDSHSLLTVVEIVSGAMTAACYIPLAKGLDLGGRAEGFVLMVSMLVLGIVLQAAAPNLPALCAGRVSYRRRSWSATPHDGIANIIYRSSLRLEEQVQFMRMRLLRSTPQA